MKLGNTSTDYERLYDLVVNKGYTVPCFAPLREGGPDDIGYVRFHKSAQNISVGYRGCCIFDVNDWEVQGKWKSIKQIFLFECEKHNLAFFDTVEGESKTELFNALNSLYDQYVIKQGETGELWNKAFDALALVKG